MFHLPVANDASRIFSPLESGSSEAFNDDCRHISVASDRLHLLFAVSHNQVACLWVLKSTPEPLSPSVSPTASKEPVSFATTFLLFMRKMAQNCNNC